MHGGNRLRPNLAPAGPNAQIGWFNFGRIQRQIRPKLPKVWFNFGRIRSNIGRTRPKFGPFWVHSDRYRSNVFPHWPELARLLPLSAKLEPGLAKFGRFPLDSEGIGENSDKSSCPRRPATGTSLGSGKCCNNYVCSADVADSPKGLCSTTRQVAQLSYDAQSTLRAPYLSAINRPEIGRTRVKLGRLRAEFGPKSIAIEPKSVDSKPQLALEIGRYLPSIGRHWAIVGPFGPNPVRHRPSLGRVWAKFGKSLRQHRPNSGHVWPASAKLGPMLADVGQEPIDSGQFRAGIGQGWPIPPTLVRFQRGVGRMWDIPGGAPFNPQRFLGNVAHINKKHRRVRARGSDDHCFVLAMSDPQR